MSEEEKLSEDGWIDYLSTVLPAIILAVVPFALLFVIYQAVKPAPKPESQPPMTTIWLGRVIAADTNSTPFSVNGIDVGLRNDGVLVWRRNVN